MREPGSEVDRIAREVIGAAIEVHRQLGTAYSESVYEEALAFELHLRDIDFVRQFTFQVTYKGKVVGLGRTDILVMGKLVVELKAVDCLAPIHTAQVTTYLRALNLHLGPVLNFNVPYMKDGVRRVILS
jgi:GxxExxY protein